jgi:hypothetical protein
MPLEYKPRVRLDSWEPPMVRRPRRSLWWLWSILLYGAVVVVGYAVVTGRLGLEPADESANTSAPTLTPSPNPTELVALPPDVSRFVERTDPAATLPPCEEFREPVSSPAGTEPSSDLERSGFSTILSDARFTNDCRSKVRRRVTLCLAVQQGSLVGVTVRTEPADSVTDQCVVRGLRGLRYPVEPTLRVLRTTVKLAKRR